MDSNNSYELTLQDLESSLSIEAFSYLLEIIEADESNVHHENKNYDTDIDSSNKKLKYPKFVIKAKVKGRNVKNTSKQRNLNSKSIISITRTSTGGNKCSDSGICSKITSKYQYMKPYEDKRLDLLATKDKSGTSSTSTSTNSTSYSNSFTTSISTITNYSKYVSTSFINDDNEDENDNGDDNLEILPLKPITGKIIQPPNKLTIKVHQKSSKKKRTTRTTTDRVCDFTKPISNPLYKSYSPRGYIKSENELISESIEELVTKFNDWIGLDWIGEDENNSDNKSDKTLMKKVTSQELYKILRIDMECP